MIKMIRDRIYNNEAYVIDQKVKVVSKAEDYEGGWENEWHENMDSFISNGEYRIIYDSCLILDENWGFSLENKNGDIYAFPSFCLELVE